MQIDVRTEGATVLVEPVGDIDAKTAPEFQERVLGLVRPNARIVLSLARVPFMSSAGLRSMLLLYREARARDARVVLTDLNKDIRNSMSATGFLSFFDVRDSLRDGMLAVG
jgi:anti-sigma B factor antagonist